MFCHVGSFNGASVVSSTPVNSFRGRDGTTVLHLPGSPLSWWVTLANLLVPGLPEMPLWAERAEPGKRGDTRGREASALGSARSPRGGAPSRAVRRGRQDLRTGPSRPTRQGPRWVSERGRFRKLRLPKHQVHTSSWPEQGKTCPRGRLFFRPEWLVWPEEPPLSALCCWCDGRHRRAALREGLSGHGQGPGAPLKATWEPLQGSGGPCQHPALNLRVSVMPFL